MLYLKVTSQEEELGCLYVFVCACQLKLCVFFASKCCVIPEVYKPVELVKCVIDINI